MPASVQTASAQTTTPAPTAQDSKTELPDPKHTLTEAEAICTLWCDIYDLNRRQPFVDKPALTFELIADYMSFLDDGTPVKDSAGEIVVITAEHVRETIAEFLSTGGTGITQAVAKAIRDGQCLHGDAAEFEKIATAWSVTLPEVRIDAKRFYKPSVTAAFIAETVRNIMRIRLDRMEAQRKAQPA